MIYGWPRNRHDAAHRITVGTNKDSQVVFGAANVHADAVVTPHGIDLFDMVDDGCCLANKWWAADSDLVSADTSVSSPQKLFIFIITK